MKIVLTGGGTAGHFYPLIAIAEELNAIFEEEKLLKASLIYMSTDPFDPKVLFDNNIEFRRVSAGKQRIYFSLLNITGLFSTALGILKALWSMYLIFPDVVISKGGYASVPAVFAARLLGIPVIIHESDAVPGRVNAWAGKFARRIALSWPEAAQFFPKEKTAVTGQPIRKELLPIVRHGAHEYLRLQKDIPVIFILGGSQGAQIVNEAVVEALPDLLNRYQVVHQVGLKNLTEIKNLSKVVLHGHREEARYHPFGYMNALALKAAAGASEVIISRAGSTIFEIAAWGLPSIIIPITESAGDHQRRNAFAYARNNACIVLEERNLSKNLLISEIDRLVEQKELREKMGSAAIKFFIPDAAQKIAREIINIAIAHEK